MTSASDCESTDTPYTVEDKVNLVILDLLPLLCIRKRRLHDVGT
jgi:hypothetical protein